MTDDYGDMSGICSECSMLSPCLIVVSSGGRLCEHCWRDWFDCEDDNECQPFDEDDDE